jgi:fucose 4-O-acetylase-like acetyltransferase
MQSESGRYFYFDNARALLVFLVILGHLIEPVMEADPAIKMLYLVIYSFHVPALVFVSGYFSKNHGRDGKKSEALRRFLIPYFVVQVLLMIFSRHVIEYKTSIFTPAHAMWYLMSLFLWHMMLPYVLRFRFPVAVSILVALAMGYSQIIGQVFSLSRTFVFLPFFLAGYFFEIAHFERLKRPSYKIASIVLFLTLAIVTYKFSGQINYRWMLGLRSYSNLGHMEWYAFVYRLSAIALFFPMTMAFLSLIPQRKLLFTQTGRRSIYPYVLHIFVYIWLSSTALLDRKLDQYEFMAIVAISAACYLVFSSRPVTLITRPFIEPKLKFLLK